MNGSFLGLLVIVLAPSHRVVVDLNAGGTEPLKATLEAVKNLKTALAPAPVEVEIVCRGPAVSQLLKTGALRAHLEQAEQQGVRFAACGNTLRAFHLSPSALSPGVTVVDAGVAELVRKEEAGW